ncbi:DNA-binding transcriptional regulator, XRE-family HTH domain [Chryseobacterium oleae]|uniref:DNA-binding transcriptional regulator, XRE-family HTH domain n=1 Tax=Chryseobacterium oleae TaxID=491207 RepID=A0A1I5C6A5_CHROL|nr:helix-turn-helix transcriptional regulator [Chryseobacterium oleae]SFN82161.1 DNA-binding transcriptional regulator, XRE-family HTH domain [Chryseobacterium oleae]
MQQEKLRKLRIQKGISQEKIAEILSTDPSNYSRKERGKIKIREEEWYKIAEALGVPVEDIKEHEIKFSAHHEHSTFHDDCGIYYQSLVDNLNDYISFLKQEINELKEEIKTLRSQ